eukprot:COSAG05_NODE_19391_length_293_cov_1.067010_1_plen_23_part_01
MDQPWLGVVVASNANALSELTVI